MFDLTCLEPPEVSCHGYAENGNMAGRSCSLVLTPRVVHVQRKFQCGMREAPEGHKNIPTLGWKSSRLTGKIDWEFVSNSGLGLERAYCLRSAYALTWRC